MANKTFLNRQLLFKLSSKYGVSLVLVALFLLGIFVRTSGTFRGYFAFTYDQGRDFLDLTQLVKYGDIRLIGPPSGIDGVFHGVWWHWFVAPIFWLCQGNPTCVVASFNIFTGVVSISLAYFLGKTIKDKNLGLLMASLVTVSSFYIGAAAQLWHPNIEPLLILALLLCLWQRLQNKRMIFITIALLLGMIFEFEVGSGGLFLPAFILTLILFKLFPKGKEMIWSIAAFSFWFWPRFVFELRHNFIQTHSAWNYFIQQKPHETTNFLVRISDRLGNIWNIFTDSFGARNQILIIFIIVVIFLYVIELYKSKDHLIKKYIAFISITLLCLLMITSLYSNTLWSYYLITIPSLILPVVGLTLYWFVKQHNMLGLTFVAMILILNLRPWSYFGPAWEGDAAVYKNQLSIVKAIYAKAQSRPFNIQVFSPSIIDYNYQYLFMWYGTKVYGYTPDRDNILTQVFLIVEPDPWNKGLRDVWLRERIGDGQTIWQENFPGGILVEQRLR